MCTWSLSLLPEKVYQTTLRCYLSSTFLSHKASDILKIGRKILTDIEVVNKSIVTMFSSLNITIRHSNSGSLVTGTSFAMDQNVQKLTIPQQFLCWIFLEKKRDSLPYCLSVMLMSEINCLPQMIQHIKTKTQVSHHKIVAVA